MILFTITSNFFLAKTCYLVIVQKNKNFVIATHSPKHTDWI